MNNEIVSGKFGSLSPKNYTIELISLCIESGMLNTAKQLEIKKALENEFTETAIQFTRSQSGSISESRAQLLASSVLYRSDVYLLSLRSHEKAASALVNMPMSSILKQGSAEILPESTQIITSTTMSPKKPTMNSGETIPHSLTVQAAHVI